MKKTSKKETKKTAITSEPPIDGKQVKRRKPLAKQKNNGITENRVELLFLIVNRSKTESYVDFLHSFGVNMCLVTPAKGTADEHMLSTLGLTDNNKTLLIGTINSERIPAVFDALDQKFKTVKNGKGIAYTVPMSGVIGSLIYGFLSNNREMVKPQKEN